MRDAIIAQYILGVINMYFEHKTVVWEIRKWDLGPSPIVCRRQVRLNHTKLDAVLQRLITRHGLRFSELDPSAQASHDRGCALHIRTMPLNAHVI